MRRRKAKQEAAGERVVEKYDSALEAVAPSAPSLEQSSPRVSGAFEQQVKDIVGYKVREAFPDISPNAMAQLILGNKPDVLILKMLALNLIAGQKEQPLFGFVIEETKPEKEKLARENLILYANDGDYDSLLAISADYSARLKRPVFIVSDKDDGDFKLSIVSGVEVNQSVEGDALTIAQLIKDVAKAYTPNKEVPELPSFVFRKKVGYEQSAREVKLKLIIDLLGGEEKAPKEPESWIDNYPTFPICMVSGAFVLLSHIDDVTRLCGNRYEADVDAAGKHLPAIDGRPCVLSAPFYVNVAKLAIATAATTGVLIACKAKRPFEKAVNAAASAAIPLYLGCTALTTYVPNCVNPYNITKAGLELATGIFGSKFFSKHIDKASGASEPAQQNAGR